ncbi:MAG: heme ABC exporter ATP-binding protein CcmA [Phototrophicales bacterium]|nr:MAG: heme ABC exporter ATP-binding protein CcmA [Phototrophicales bacterium]
MIKIQKLVKAFGYFPVLRGLDLEIGAGQFVALLGPNGSGKTTLLRILAGLSKPTSGTITIGGWSIPDEIAAVRQQLGIVSHQTLLYDTLTAEENLLFFARLYNIPTDERMDRIHALLNNVGLGARAKDVVQTFSRGMQQRLAIARALLSDPAILLLDEPYTGLDQDAAALLDELLHEVAGVGTSQRTAIMTTHDLRRAYELTTHVAILQRGKIGYFGETAVIHDLPALYAETVEAKTIT